MKGIFSLSVQGKALGKDGKHYSSLLFRVLNYNHEKNILFFHSSLRHLLLRYDIWRSFIFPPSSCRSNIYVRIFEIFNGIF